jgi:hypothetical protein
MSSKFDMTEQAVDGLISLQQPEGQIEMWQRAWDKLTYSHLDRKEARLRQEPSGWDQIPGQ